MKIEYNNIIYKKKIKFLTFSTFLIQFAIKKKFQEVNFMKFLMKRKST
jgi:hypothetical protein